MPAVNLSSTPTPTTPPITLTAAPTQAPAATPTVSANHVVLVVPPNSDPQLAQDSEKTINELAAAAGMNVVKVQSLNPEELNPGIKLIFYTAIANNIPQVVAAGPEIQFAIISPVDINPVPNFNVIRLQTERRTFISGMVTILIADDWRSLALLPIQDPPYTTLAEAFTNGAQHYCGICNAFFNPAARFPFVRQVDANNYQAMVDDANKSIIYSIFVSPEVSTPEMISSLAAQKYILVGGETPPEDAKTFWAATVRENVSPPIRQLWPEMMNGQGGKIVNTSILLEDVNPNYLSTGKKALVLEAIQELENGLLLPLTPSMQ